MNHSLTFITLILLYAASALRCYCKEMYSFCGVFLLGMFVILWAYAMIHKVERME